MSGAASRGRSARELRSELRLLHLQMMKVRARLALLEETQAALKDQLEAAERQDAPPKLARAARAAGFQ